MELNIPPSKVGISRRDMPQILSTDTKDFFKYLKSQHGISTRKRKMPVSALSITQADINKDKVNGMMKAKTAQALGKPIIISNDGFILDGHHRFVALLNMDPDYKLTTFQVGTDIMSLLKLARGYDGTFHKGINEGDVPSFLEYLKGE